MAQLIKPDGTNGIVTTLPDAVAYCAEHPGWTWRYAECGDEGE